MQKRKDLYSNDDTFKDRNTVKLKDWKPVTLILVIEDYAQKLPAATHNYILRFNVFVWRYRLDGSLSVRGWGLNVSVVTAETGFD